MESRSLLQRVLVAGLAAGLVAMLVGVYTAQMAGAQSPSGQPANKTAVAGSTIDKFDDATPVLTETMKVSTTEDLILQLTAECSILTSLVTGGSQTGGATDTATASGTVQMWITIDGTPVPVALDDANQDGKVVFCNRTYSRTVTDEESQPDGLDEESDFIETRDANAFNWFAINGGSFYDNPDNGNNIIEIIVWADFITSEVGEAEADAFVGQRTLVVEPVHAANDEVVAPVDPTASPDTAGSKKP